MDQKYERFGGWLSLFWLICMYNSFILTLNVFGYGRFLFLPAGPESSHTRVVYGAFAIENMIIGCLFFIIALKLIKRDPETPLLAKRLLALNIILGGVYLIVNGVISQTVFHVKLQIEAAELRNPLVMLMGSWIWLAYFTKSKRVRTYYRLTGSTPGPDDANP